jgi:hypothetical protein
MGSAGCRLQEMLCFRKFAAAQQYEQCVASCADLWSCYLHMKRVTDMLLMLHMTSGILQVNILHCRQHMGAALQCKQVPEGLGFSSQLLVL